MSLQGLRPAGFLPRGLAVVIGPSDGTSTTLIGHLVAKRGLPHTDIITLSGPRAADAVKARLRTQSPLVVDATPSTEQLKLVGLLATEARRFDVPVTAVRLPGSTVSTDALEALGCELVLDSDQVRGVLWGGGLGQLRDVDVVGDVHGQADALDRLCAELGYEGNLGDAGFGHPDGRILVFVGDLVDKGDRNIDVLRKVRAAMRRGQAISVRGNHEQKLVKTLTRIVQEARGNQRKDPEYWARALHTEADGASWGRETTLRELAEDTEGASRAFTSERQWLNSLPLHLNLDGGNLVVVHAAVRGEHIGVDPESNRQRREIEGWALYGPTTGRKTPQGYPERIDWIPEYTGEATVVRGHVVHDEPEDRNNVVSVDTGAGDGARLTAMSWPARRFTSVAVDGSRDEEVHATAAALV